MARIVCVANQKGGVGKTTTAINLAACTAMAGCHTLLVDLDPQCNATSGLGHKPTDRHPLAAGGGIKEYCLETSLPGLSLLPGSRSFEDIHSLSGSSQAQTADLARHLASGLGGYDLVFIDSPPSLGPLTQMALACATEILIPIQCEYFAMEGLTQMIEVLRQVMAQAEVRLQFGGISLTMYDHSLELTNEVDRDVRDFFGEIVYRTVVPRDVTVSEAPSHSLPVVKYSPRSRGARAYVELCMEVLERV